MGNDSTATQSQSLLKRLYGRLDDLYLLLSGRYTAQFKTSFHQVRLRLDALEAFEGRINRSPLNKSIHMPAVALHQRSMSEPFMAYSTCSAADLFHPRCAEIAALFGGEIRYHRKFWEWVYILHCALENDLGQGKRALGFGVGSETIPAVFARLGAEVTATDAPVEIGVGNGWTTGGQFSTGAETLVFEGILDEAMFRQRVAFEVCDMNAIAGHLTGYDFVWSSCCLEHLGSIQQGLDFILNSVEKTLKVGGIACHTTELNLSSNDATVESGDTVLFRKRDLDAFVLLLRERGHEVRDITIAPDAHHLDGYVDLPPYTSTPHLKLLIGGYASTSVGLVIRRGR